MKNLLLTFIIGVLLISSSCRKDTDTKPYVNEITYKNLNFRISPGIAYGSVYYSFGQIENQVIVKDIDSMDTMIFFNSAVNATIRYSFSSFSQRDSTDSIFYFMVYSDKNLIYIDSAKVHTMMSGSFQVK